MYEDSQLTHARGQTDKLTVWLRRQRTTVRFAASKSVYLKARVGQSDVPISSRSATVARQGQAGVQDIDRLRHEPRGIIDNRYAGKEAR
jgi:hypothetical protein